MYLGCCSTFGKRKTTFACGSFVFTLSETLACMDHAILHGKPFSNPLIIGDSNQWEQYFGMTLCQSRMLIKCAFGRLKACFGALNLSEQLILTLMSCHLLCMQRIGEDKVVASMEHERNFQSVTTSNNIRTECIEAEGKKIRRHSPPQSL